MSIQRYKGIELGWPGAGLRPGGGYTGATKELDDAVMDGARLLQLASGRDVEVRFNSDRMSGGAWLKDSLPRLVANCHVGVRAELRRPIPRQDFEAALDLPFWERSVRLRELKEAYPRVLVVESYLKRCVVPNAEPCSRVWEEACLLEDHPTIAAAIAYVLSVVGDWERVPR